eukprot:jgi/Mesen1/1475/ME000132S00415
MIAVHIVLRPPVSRTFRLISTVGISWAGATYGKFLAVEPCVQRLLSLPNSPVSGELYHILQEMNPEHPALRHMRAMGFGDDGNSLVLPRLPPRPSADEAAAESVRIWQQPGSWKTSGAAHGAASSDRHASDGRGEVEYGAEGPEGAGAGESARGKGHRSGTAGGRTWSSNGGRASSSGAGSRAGDMAGSTRSANSDAAAAADDMLGDSFYFATSHDSSSSGDGGCASPRSSTAPRQHEEVRRSRMSAAERREHNRQRYLDWQEAKRRAGGGPQA